MAGKEPRNTKAVSTKAAKNAEKEREEASFSLASIRRFTRDVKNEFGKIVWPSRKVTLRLAAVVLVMTAVMSLYLGLVDILLGSLVSRIL